MRGSRWGLSHLEHHPKLLFPVLGKAALPSLEPEELIAGGILPDWAADQCLSNLEAVTGPDLSHTPTRDSSTRSEGPVPQQARAYQVEEALIQEEAGY